MLSECVLHFLEKGHKLLFLFSRGRDKVSSSVSEDVRVERWEIFQKVLTHFFLYDSAISFDINESSWLTFFLLLVRVPKHMECGNGHTSLMLSQQTLKQLSVILSSRDKSRNKDAKSVNINDWLIKRFKSFFITYLTHLNFWRHFRAPVLPASFWTNQRAVFKLLSNERWRGVQELQGLRSNAARNLSVALFQHFHSSCSSQGLIQYYFMHS